MSRFGLKQYSYKGCELKCHHWTCEVPPSPRPPFSARSHRRSYIISQNETPSPFPPSHLSKPACWQGLRCTSSHDRGEPGARGRVPVQPAHPEQDTHSDMALCGPSPSPLPLPPPHSDRHSAQLADSDLVALVLLCSVPTGAARRGGSTACSEQSRAPSRCDRGTGSRNSRCLRKQGQPGQGLSWWERHPVPQRLQV